MLYVTSKSLARLKQIRMVRDGASKRTGRPFYLDTGAWRVGESFDLLEAQQRLLFPVFLLNFLQEKQEKQQGKNV